MEMGSLFSLQGTLFLLVAAGVILRKLNILPQAGTAILTDLVIYLILPCNIIYSFQMKLSFDIMKGFIIVFTISILVQAVCLILSNTLYNKQPASIKQVLQYATCCSNAGFMGNPIAEGMFGAQGLMYASIFLIPLRIVMWSAGVAYFTKSPDRKTVIKKVVTHPCIVAVYIGLALMISQIPLPVFLYNTIRSVGGCTTTLSMLLIGTILAEVDIKTILSKTLIYFTLIRLFLIPLLVFVGCKLCHVDPLLTGVSVLLAGMPAGSTTAILSAKYGGNYIFGTKCVVFTTLMSLITIPLWCMLL